MSKTNMSLTPNKSSIESVGATYRLKIQASFPNSNSKKEGEEGNL